MTIRLLHVSDRTSGFVADTLRALTDQGFDVLSLDIRAFSTQKIYDPEASATFDRLAWLQTHEPEALARLRWADVILVESGGFALSWISRAGLGIPVVARLGRADCEAPALFMVDWTSVGHILFADEGGRSAFRALLPGVLDQLPTSVAPVYLAPSRFVSGRQAPRGGTRLSLVVVGDVSHDPGAATAVRIGRRLADHDIQLDVMAEGEAPGTSEVALRRKALLRATQQRSDPGLWGDSGAETTTPAADAPDYVLCASPSLGASFSVAVRVARGARPLLKRGVAAAEDWLGDAALVYDGADQAVAFILDPNAPKTAAETLASRCGNTALETLANALRSFDGTASPVV